jgi:hypothetical protein
MVRPRSRRRGGGAAAAEDGAARRGVAAAERGRAGRAPGEAAAGVGDVVRWARQPAGSEERGASRALSLTATTPGWLYSLPVYRKMESPNGRPVAFCSLFKL